MLTFQVLSTLLRYPVPELNAELAAAEQILRREAILPLAHLEAVSAYLAGLKVTPQLEAESAYIDAFDKGRSTSLHLFEHIHGDNRARGEALHRLLLRYRAHGLELASRELPDFLPLFLEFLSTRPLAEARKHMAEVTDIAALIGRRLRARSAPHAPLLEAIAALAPPGVSADQQLDEVPPRDDTPGALDAAWEEAPVTFNDAAIAQTAPHS